MSKQTKRVTVSPNILQNLAGNEEDALAYFLQMAFGATLEDILSAILYAISTKNSKVIQMCATAGVQIRGNVTLVGPEPTMRVPELKVFIIEGQRDLQDAYNFSALHIAGHMLALITSNPWGKKISSKAGNCVNGDSFPDSDAGKINKEIRGSWSQESLSFVLEAIRDLKPELKAYIDKHFSGVTARAANFSKLISPVSTTAGKQTSKPPTVATTASAQPSGNLS
jgi:hypothetical protein